MEGPYVEYYPNGNIQSVCKCKNNRIEGEYTEWYPDGSLKEEAIYVNGVKHGESTTWKQVGYARIAKTTLYDNGVFVSSNLQPFKF